MLAEKIANLFYGLSKPFLSFLVPETSQDGFWWAKALAAQFNNPRVTPGTHMVEGENQILHVALFLPYSCCGMYTHINKCMGEKEREAVEAGEMV